MGYYQTIEKQNDLVFLKSRRTKIFELQILAMWFLPKFAAFTVFIFIRCITSVLFIFFKNIFIYFLNK